MKVAVIGAQGQLGSDLIATKPDQIDLVPLTRKELDITDKKHVDTVLSEVRPDVVINTAAYVRVDDAEDSAAEAFMVNAVAVRDLAVACSRLNAALLHISTDFVFDGAKAPQPYNEDDLPNPLGVYGMTKFAGEVFLRNNGAHNYIVRVSGLYGAQGARGKGGNFVSAILKKAKAGEPLSVVHDIYTSPTYTYDSAKGIWNLIIEKKQFGIYHMANAGYCSWYEFARAILEIAGVHAEITPVSHKEYPAKAQRALWSVLESTKSTPLRSWQEALEDFIKRGADI